MVQYIELKNEKYYLWDTYSSREEANKQAKQLKKETGTQYFIITQSGTLSTETKHKLYLNKIRRVI